MYHNTVTVILVFILNLCSDFVSILQIPRVAADRILLNNNVHELVFENYFHKMVRDWRLNEFILDLSESQKAKMKGDLKGLYNTLKHHPALMERRLQVGANFPPALTEYHESNHSLKKRSIFDIGIAEPICPFKTEWLLLLRAKDMNNSEVEIFQPTDNSNRYQWFYTVSCDFDTLIEENRHCPYCCRGISANRYASQCIPRKSYVMALVRKRPEHSFDWDYIQVDTSCNCAVSPAG